MISDDFPLCLIDDSIEGGLTSSQHLHSSSSTVANDSMNNKTALMDSFDRVCCVSTVDKVTIKVNWTGY